MGFDYWLRIVDEKRKEIVKLDPDSYLDHLNRLLGLVNNHIEEYLDEETMKIINRLLCNAILYDRNEDIDAQNNKKLQEMRGIEAETLYYSKYTLKPEEVINALLEIKKILKRNASKINKKFDIYYSINFDEILDEEYVEGEYLYCKGVIKSAARKKNVSFGGKRFIYLDGVKKIVSGENECYLKSLLGKRTDLTKLKEIRCRLLKNEVSSLMWIKPKIGKEVTLKIEKYSELADYIDCINKLIKTCELARKKNAFLDSFYDF